MGDAIITLGGCDKSVPGALMPLARRNLIGLTLYGGTSVLRIFFRVFKIYSTIRSGAAHPGYLPGKRGLDGGSVFIIACSLFTAQLRLNVLYSSLKVMEGIGALGAGLIDIEDMYVNVSPTF